MTKCPTCGDEYASEHGVKIHHKKSHGESLKPKITCELCGNEEYVKPKRSDARFCSSDCWYSHKRGGDKPTKGELKRLHWDEELSVLEMSERHDVARITITRWMDDYGLDWRSPSEAERLKNRQRSFEERKNQTQAANEKAREMVQNGEWHLQKDNPLRRGYGEGWTEEKREEVREDYDRECQSCGINEGDYSRKLDVHHIIPASEFDDPQKRNAKENLVPLCRSCHRETEGKYNRPSLAD